VLKYLPERRLPPLNGILDQMCEFDPTYLDFGNSLLNIFIFSSLSWH
jgi:hypothetical protein